MTDADTIPGVDVSRIAQSVRDAHARIAGIVRKTPLERAPFLDAGGARVFLKLEHLQHTGSFKLRGAAAKLTSLSPAARDAGVITASTGNHGLGVAYAARAIGMRPPVVFVPSTADAGKLDRLRAMGAEVIVSGATCVDAEHTAGERAHDERRVYVSPYNDLDVVAGQGTVGLEIVEDAGSLADSHKGVDVVYVAVGGGGLISGVASAVKAAYPSARIVGCLPANSDGMLASIRAGRVVEAPELPTLSDATAGGVEVGSVTFPLCHTLVDDWLTVSEDEIVAAWRRLFAAERHVVEGAAAVAVAGFLKDTQPAAARNAAIVLCGRNLSATQLRVLLTP